MKSAEYWVLGYVLNSLWQIPVVFLAAWAGARLVRKAGPRAEHRVWVGAMLLEIIVPACRFGIGDMWNMVRGLLPVAGQDGGEARVVMGPAVVSQTGIHVPPLILIAVLVTYSACVAYSSIRLVWGLWKTSLLSKNANPLARDGELARAWLRSSHVFASESSCPPVAVAVSPVVSAPVTLGLRRWVLLLPPGFLHNVAPSDLDALLAHEFAHMRRRDFGKNLFYGVLALPAAYHPLLWLTRARVAETRELVCDAMAADALAGRQDYARSLLRLASALSHTEPAVALHAVGIFDTNNLERRIMDLKRKQTELGGAHRAAIITACAAIALTACASALALRMEVTGPDNQNPPAKASRVNVNAKELKIVQKVPPVYPVEAKSSGNTINGPVVLDVIVGTTGQVENIKVKKSLLDDYDQSAIDAVRQWRFEPFRLNGEPVEVKTTINVTYSLKK